MKTMFSSKKSLINLIRDKGMQKLMETCRKLKKITTKQRRSRITNSLSATSNAKRIPNRGQ